MKAIKDMLDGFAWSVEETLALIKQLLGAFRISSWYEAGQVLGVALLFTLAVLSVAHGIVMLKGVLL
jgi:hypothetical protein